MLRENNLEKLLKDEETIDLTLSYSRISDFDRNGPRALIRRSEESNDGMKHGSLVDDLLTDKVTGSQIYKEKYYLYDGNKPTATLGFLCDIILKNYEKIPDIKTVLKIVKHNAFWNSTKDEDKLIAKFDLPEFWDYLNVMYLTTDKKVITTNDDLAAKEAVSILLNHEYSKHLYFNENENFYQLPFEIKYKNFKIRGILDRLSIDHKNKIVYMDDLKTGAGKGESFLKSFIDYRYYFQGAIYIKAFDFFCEKLNLKDYTLAPFKFIYLGKTEKVPFIFTFTDKWNNAAINGFTTLSGYKYSGLDECIDKIYYHWKNDKYEFSQEIYQNNGCLNLNDEFIKVNE
jgi:hypothetical protein